MKIYSWGLGVREGEVGSIFFLKMFSREKNLRNIVWGLGSRVGEIDSIFSLKISAREENSERYGLGFCNEGGRGRFVFYARFFRTRKII